MVKKRELFTCEICGTEYGSKSAAEYCESAPPLPPCPVRVGDTVKVYERYGSPEADQVLDVFVGGAMLEMASVFGSTTETDQAFLRMMERSDQPLTRHQWIVKTRNEHQKSKDQDSYSDKHQLSDIMIDGNWLKDIEV